MTYRYVGHSKSDKQVYRSSDEVKQWKQRDPIANFQAWLVQQGHLTQDGVKELEARVTQTIEDAIAFGDASPEPAIAHLTDDVYSEEAGGAGGPRSCAAGVDQREVRAKHPHQP